MPDLFPKPSSRPQNGAAGGGGDNTVSPPVLALPKGGGALRGIDEKFSVNAATGTCSFSVPLALSPGRSGFSPPLSLQYDSGSGNGPFGLGWSLSLPSISRKTDKGLPRYRDTDDADTFLLSGAEDLVPALTRVGNLWVDETRDVAEGPDLYTVRRYRPRLEGLFARIERWTHRTTGDAHWRSIAKDNVTSFYGRTSNARLTDPVDPRRIFQWFLQEMRDDKGNIIRYDYKRENGQGVPSAVWEKNRLDPSAFTQRYLKRVTYANQLPHQAADWHFELVFDYGDHNDQNPTPQEDRPWSVRRDSYSVYRSGFEVRTHRLCRRALMFHRFPELGPDPCLVKSTDFTYRQEAFASFLLSVENTGYRRGPGGYDRQKLPPLSFNYAAAVLHESVQSVDGVSLENLPQGGDGPLYQWTDLDGEGISGLLTNQGDSWFYKRNLGDGRFAPVSSALSRPTPLDGRGGPQLMDIAGEGRPALVHFDAPTPGFFERNARDQWEGFVPFSSHAKIDWDDPNLKFIDLNGDGRTDVLIAGDHVFQWHGSLGRAGFAPAETVRKPLDEEAGPAVLFRDATQSIFLADMSGDGLTDLARIRNGDICYWPNLGYGRFGAKVTMGRAPVFDDADQFDPKRLRLADVDGTGVADLVYLGREGATLWFNEAGNAWSPPRRLAGFPAVDSLSSVTLTDVLGTGTSCLVWSSPLPGNARHPFRYIDLMGGRKPHVLISIANNSGKETRLQYASSTKFYLADREVGRPWITKLPFPVQVVERVETRDSITGVKSVTLYRYHHGAYDGKEREFRGFGLVEQEDAESFTEYRKDGLFPASPPVAAELFQPPTLTKTWFHTGLYIEGNDISSRFSDAYYAGDPQAWLLPDTVLPPGLDRSEERDAVRALKGGTLRQELYALDRTPNSGHPYSVVEGNFEVRLLQPGKGSRPGVFLTHPRETLRFHYERNPLDPRIDHDLTLAVDDFGNVSRSAAVVYPRRAAPFPEQQGVLATVSEADFINRPNEPTWYRVGLSTETRTYELAGLTAPANGPFSTLSIAQAFGNAAPVPYEDLSPPPAGQTKRRLIERVRTLYGKNDQTGPLLLGEVESLGLPYRTYKMVFTPGLLAGIYGAHGAGPALENTLTQDGKYVLWDGVWWVPSGRQTYAAGQFYLPVRFMDPFIEPLNLAYVTVYDNYSLLVERTRDPLNNEMVARNNYRVLGPWHVTDVNQNRSAVRFDLLGLVSASAVMGKGGEGDVMDETTSEPSPLDDPSTRMTYDHFRWMNFGAPNMAHSLSREQHGALNPRWQEVYTYSDGSGHEIMRKIQAEPGRAPGRDALGHVKRDAQGRLIFENAPARWVGTGRTVYNNKGMPVKQYEPFFDSSPVYTEERDLVEWGFSPVLTYDPLNRLMRVDQPDGRFSRQTFDAWKQEAWDENDTVLESAWYAQRQALPVGDFERRAADLAATHAQTPSTTHLDTLGRVFLTEAHNGFDGAGAPLLHRAHVALDIEGNRRFLTNAENNVLMEFAYDMVGRALFQRGADTGPRWTVPDMVGKSLLGWDGPLNGPTTFQTRNTYDMLQRPEKFFVKKGVAAETLAEWTVYGDAQPNAELNNLRGKVYRLYDGAGCSTHARYDFKGNLTRVGRQVTADYTLTPDWNNPPPLDPEVFSSLTDYDALSRPVRLANDHDGSVIEPSYNEANLLESMDVRVRGGAVQPFIKNIDYDAKGQRVLIRYGSDVETAYAYDPKTFRLSSLTTTSPAGPAPLQGLRYTYDPVGNVTDLLDVAQADIYFANALILPNMKFRYDALYRLVQAEGREHRGAGVSPQPEYDWKDEFRVALPHPNDGQKLRTYTEHYTYDRVGNITRLDHQADQGHWVRRYEYVPGTNRLRSSSLPGDPPGPLLERHTYDNRGNMTKMPHIHTLGWDVEDQLVSVDRQGGGQAYYAYDAKGQRVRKVVVKNNGALVEERIYVGGYEIFRRRENNILTLERQTLHVMDDNKRIALVETQTQNALGPILNPVPVFRYQLGNHLGSASLELDEKGAIISYEEYYPYGGTAYQGGTVVAQTSLKRYRYIGKERDEETGFYYCQARYYAPWIGRWISPDPLGLDGGQNLYEYAASNPMAYKDDTGTAPTLTPLQAASVAEDSGKGALVAKYSKVAEVVDVTPVKNVSANGVDAHLVVGKGPAAVNIIGDVKHANAASKTGGSLIYSGKEVAGEISAFENAAKQQHGQLVKNLRAARASGALDPATAYHAIEGAKAGQVIHEVVPSGYNTGVEKTIVGKYQANVTPNDTFAEAAAHRQGLEFKEATKGYGKGKAANPETVFKRIQKASGSAGKGGKTPVKSGAGGAKSLASAEVPKVARATNVAETPVAASATKNMTAPKPTSAVAASGGSKLLSGAKSMAGGTLAVAGSALGGWQVGSGINAVVEGRTGEGAVDIAEGGANLAMSIGSAYAVKTGAIVVGGGSAMATAAGVAAGASVALAAETVRAAMKGEPTPVDVADQFYGTHFGDIAGWVRGDYAKR